MIALYYASPFRLFNMQGESRNNLKKEYFKKSFLVHKFFSLTFQ